MSNAGGAVSGSAGSSSLPLSLCSARFNQDGGCFACATSRGFRVFNCDPLKETFRREVKGGGLAIVEMLFRCNILAIVGGGSMPKYPTNKVMIWDDHQNRCIGELSFRSEVRNVKLRRDRVVVVLETKVYVYNFENLKPVHQVETCGNPGGLCALSSDTNANVLACPGLQRGQVRIELYNLRRTRFIAAHESAIACMELCQDGSLLATASEKGTLIRIFDTMEGKLLQEVRRGTDSATIFCLAFAVDLKWIAASSDKATVHIWGLHFSSGDVVNRRDSIETSSPTTTPERKGSSSAFSMVKGFLPRYFSSEWSVAQYHLPDASRSAITFGTQETIVNVVTASGGFHKLRFDGTSGGECEQVIYSRILKDQEE